MAEQGLLLDAEKLECIEKSHLLNNEGLARAPINSKNVLFDRKKAFDIFSAQLGMQYTAFYDMPEYLQALTMAFILFGNGKKDICMTILAKLSQSFRWDKDQYHLCCTIPLAIAERERLWQKALPVAHTAFCHPLVYGLYANARNCGVLTSAEFIWLKPVNRTLFYFLNNYGRRTAWVECAGCVSHYAAEEERGVLGEASVLTAVNALEIAMYEGGWLQTLSDEAISMSRS